jgi:hypothetical protein
MGMAGRRGLTVKRRITALDPEHDYLATAVGLVIAAPPGCLIASTARDQEGLRCAH